MTEANFRSETASGSEQLGLFEAVSFALGGIVGGGIFAVLGVVAAVAGPTAWLAYLIAGVVALCTGYSYVKLNAASDRRGGSVTLIESYTDRPAVAGVVGWTLVVGYVGTMAMYGYAFGAYFALLFGIERIPVVGVPTRPVLSALVVLAFVGVNLAGVRESGLVEDLLVALKMGIVLLFGVLGIWYGLSRGELAFGTAAVVADPAGPFVAAAISFVSFEGWQLLMYDQESIRDPVETTTKAVYLSIPVATLSYVLVALVTISLVSRPEVVAHPDVALAVAAREFMGAWGYLLVGVAAVASTASAINATLFSTAHFARNMVADGLLPDRLGDPSAEGVPARALVVIGLLTVAFTVLGSLEAITEFASLAFVVVFGVMSALAIVERDRAAIRPSIPVVGFLCCTVFLPVFVWHLYVEQFDTLLLVVAVAATVVAVEVGYFERRTILEGVHELERRF